MTETFYTMTPIDNGTRVRTDHNTFASVITSYNRGQLIRGDEVWEAPSDGPEVKKGDIWLRVTHVDNVELQPHEQGWMAYIHKGYQICKDFEAHEDGGSGGGDETVYVVLPVSVQVDAVKGQDGAGAVEIYVDRKGTPTSIFVKNGIGNFVAIELPPME